MKTNVCKFFIRFVDKHFLRHHKYFELFKGNNIKLSYSCMPDMNNVIRKHYSKIMKNPTCNCRRKTDYSMDGNCLSECLIYKASVSTFNNNYYYGSCEILSKNVTITINVLLEINLMKRILNCPSTYGNCKKDILIISLFLGYCYEIAQICL